MHQHATYRWLGTKGTLACEASVGPLRLFGSCMACYACMHVSSLNACTASFACFACKWGKSLANASFSLHSKLRTSRYIPYVCILTYGTYVRYIQVCRYLTIVRYVSQATFFSCTVAIVLHTIVCNSMHCNAIACFACN